jgi:RNA polymerase sigma factor (sigma-70 family)
MVAPNLLPDPKLIEACLSGKSEAWEALIARYQRLIYTIPIRYGFSEAEAGDVFQAVSLILLENLARLRDRERLGAWLSTVTRRECWRLARQRHQTMPESDWAFFENQAAEGSRPEDGIVHLERQTLVRTAVDHLGGRCRRLLNLLFYTEPRPSYKEIAQLLHLPEGSIGPTRARCLEKLVKILDGMSFF